MANTRSHGLHDLALTIEKPEFVKKPKTFRSKKKIVELGKVLLREILFEKDLKEKRTTSTLPCKRKRTTIQTMNRLVHLLKSKPPDETNELLKTQLKDLLPPKVFQRYEKLRSEELFHVLHFRKKWIYSLLKKLRIDTTTAKANYTSQAFVDQHDVNLNNMI